MIMKVFISKVRTCRNCPVESLRTTTWPESEHVCLLFMDEHEHGRRGRVIDNDICKVGIPNWCPLDNIVEDVDGDGNAVYVISANQQKDDPKFTYSNLHKDVVKWRDIV